jgi:hypothetical protein
VEEWVSFVRFLWYALLFGISHVLWERCTTWRPNNDQESASQRIKDTIDLLCRTVFHGRLLLEGVVIHLPCKLCVHFSSRILSLGTKSFFTKRKMLTKWNRPMASMTSTNNNTYTKLRKSIYSQAGIFFKSDSMQLSKLVLVFEAVQIMLYKTNYFFVYQIFGYAGYPSNRRHSPG